MLNELERDIYRAILSQLDTICEKLDDVRRKHGLSDREFAGELRDFPDIQDYFEEWVKECRL